MADINQIKVFFIYGILLVIKDLFRILLESAIRGLICVCFDRFFIRIRIRQKIRITSPISNNMIVNVSASFYESYNNINEKDHAKHLSRRVEAIKNLIATAKVS